MSAGLCRIYFSEGGCASPATLPIVYLKHDRVTPSFPEPPVTKEFFSRCRRGLEAALLNSHCFCITRSWEIPQGRTVFRPSIVEYSEPPPAGLESPFVKVLVC